MRRFAILLLGCFPLAVPASALTIDFSKITCKEFFDTHKGDANLLLAWLSGYSREENDPPVLDVDEFNADAKKISTYCAAHPTEIMSKAADEIFGN